MRTTLAIDDDVLSAVRAMARRQGRPAGEVLSELARRELTRRPEALPSSRNGLPLLPSRGTVVTNPLVEGLREEEGV